MTTATSSLRFLLLLLLIHIKRSIPFLHPYYHHKSTRFFTESIIDSKPTCFVTSRIRPRPRPIQQRKRPNLFHSTTSTTTSTTSTTASLASQELFLLQNRTSELLSSSSPITPQWIFECRHIMSAWAQQHSKSAVIQIEILLKRIIDERRSGNKIAVANTRIYNILLEGWAWSREGERGAQRAEDILSHMLMHHDDDYSLDVWPNARSFEMVIKAWAHSGVEDKGTRAQRILAYMEELSDMDDYDDKYRRLKPNAACYNEVLSAWAYPPGNDPRIAQEILERMMESYESNPTICPKPDTKCFTTVIEAWGRSSDPCAAPNAEAILRQMLTASEHDLDNSVVVPNRKCFSTVIRSYSKSNSPGAAQKAEQLLHKMHQSYLRTGNDDLKLQTILFTSVLNAYANSREKGAAQHAENLLKRMEEMYCREQDPKLKPNTVSFNMVLHAWCESREEGSAKRAERILNRMDRLYRQQKYNGSLKPNTIGFNIVIKAWCWSGKTKRAEQLLQRMETLWRSGEETMKPDVRSFGPVMNAYGRSREEGSAEKAYRLLLKMEHLYEEGHVTLKPDKKCYAAVINAYSKSRQPGKAVQAQKLLHRMHNLYMAGNKDLKPDHFIFNTVMNTCAFSVNGLDDQQRALDITYRTFKELEEFDVPDHIIYSTFLKACRNLMPMGDQARSQIVAAVFRKCCREGHVSAIVLRELKKAASYKLYCQLLRGVHIGEGGRVEPKDLPKEWKRNVGYVGAAGGGNGAANVARQRIRNP